MSEETFKRLGEELTNAAVDSDMAAKQLQTIYQLVKRKPLAFVETHLKRQMSRDIPGKAGFKKALEILNMYRDDKASLEKTLMYADMLYDYVKRKPAIDLEVSAEPIVKRVLNRRGIGYGGLTADISGGSCRIEVKAGRFHGSPKQLSMEIMRELKNNEKFSGLNLSVWIKME